MLFSIHEFGTLFKNHNVRIMFRGTVFGDGLMSIVSMVKSNLSHDKIPDNAAKAVFSVCVEQITNMLMYSAAKEQFEQGEPDDVAEDTFILGYEGTTCFIQTGNIIKNENIELVKSRIEHLNSLDKKGLRMYYREQLRGTNDNPESKGGGLGLIEIARQATAPIEYMFEPLNDKLSYFTMYVEISQEKKNEQKINLNTGEN